MSTPTEAIREKTVAGNEEYLRLQSEHASYAAQLNSLLSKPFLSEEERIEEVRLKKLKLHLKDQMVALAHHARPHN